MNSKLSLILAMGKNYIQSLQSEQGRRVVSVIAGHAGLVDVCCWSLEFTHTGTDAAGNGRNEA